MSTHQAVPAQVPPAPLDPTQSLFHNLRDCLTLEDPAECNARARSVLNAGNTGFIANCGIPELIGLACEVAVNLTDRWELADVAGQLLTPRARSVMAGSADADSLVWSVIAAHCLLTEEARMEAVGGLLSTQAASERMANMAFGYATGMDPSVDRDGLLRQYLTPSTCCAIARSNSFLAIGEAGYAITRLPPEERGAAAATLLPRGAAAVGMSGNVRAIMQTLKAATFLPPDALEATLEPLFIPKARAALARSADPKVISKATYAAATLLPPGFLRGAVLQELLVPSACGVVADTGHVDDRVDTAFAATLLPPGPARDAVLVRLLPEDVCGLVGRQGSLSSWARLSFAVAHLENEGVRTQMLMSFVPYACFKVANFGTDQDVKLMGYAAELLPAGFHSDGVMQLLGPRLAALAPPHWRDIEAGPQAGAAGPAGAAARAAGPSGP